ncbi:multifunctional protein ADE2 [Periophthalmus magnuspinnatus]|uniref:multifunctional protein ADE2 n=1 Tax=Periophthalmus magnuspinnatus TaxID=409849 RepID=UPI00243636A3|nr:multifunctional protein ADE2 [Periophthalmus magnuspinnatus]
MEKRAQKQRGGESVPVESAVQWAEAEVLALMKVWSELGPREESRATYELLSDALRRLRVLRSWRECQAQCRSLGLHCTNTKEEDPGLDYNPERHRMGPTAVKEDWEDEHGGGNTRGMFQSPMQEGMKVIVHRALSYNAGTAEEGGRHWSDDEVRALLCVWADKNIRERLKCTLRNKTIFQEMSRLMEKNFGIVRNWKQCRTKYKNLKYDYKTVKTTLDAGGSSSVAGPNKYMKFFEEVEAIMLDHGLERGSLDMQKRVFDGEMATLNTTGPENETVIEIDDDDNSDEYDGDGEVDTGNWKGTDASSSDQIQVVTISDTGRNWSDQEVRALIQVWSDERVRTQLESSTRKRDIFIQISNLLMQQGIERDWKQCHTKYKNLKYLYRSLQRSRTEKSDPRHLMRFYEELDAIMNRPKNNNISSSPQDTTSHMDYNLDTAQIPTLDNDDHTDAYLPDVNNVTSIAAQTGSTSESGLSMSFELTPNTQEEGTHTNRENCKDKQTNHTVQLEKRPERINVPSTNRGQKRKAEEQAPTAQSITGKRINTGVSTVQRVDSCKEEQVHFPIIKINSVHSMASSDTSQDTQDLGLFQTTMASTLEIKVGQKLNEGKTKQIFELVDQPGQVLVQSKDQITAGNAVRKDQMEGKAAIANKTTSCVFKLLQESGVKTAFVKQHSDTAFIAAHCEMIPIEWVCRRIATGSFLKRNPGVKEGYRFSPLKMEMFFKDDANNDPQWSEEQILAANFNLAGLSIGKCEVDIMSRSTVAIFEILERAWATQDCTLVDMKIEFGVNVKTQEIVLADVIDNDSWRLWPSGDRSQQKDKQVYRDLKEVTPEAMQMVKRNFEWVAERVQLLHESQTNGRVVVLMGSTSDMAHCEKIKKACTSYGIPCILRVTSAHKGPDETLRIKAEYEGDGVPTVFVAVAGRSNGLGPVMSGNTVYPVINCPPLTPDWGAQDVWSSLRMPSGLGCSTILSPDASAQFAAQIFGLTNHLVWCKLRASMLNTWVSLKLADKKLQACSI